MPEAEYEAFTKFFFNEKWLSLVTLVYVFTAKPDTSLDREYANLLTRKAGSVMRDDILRDYNFAVQNCVEEYGGMFSRIARLDTSNKDQNQVGYLVTSQVLDILDDVLQERIAYFEGVQPPSNKNPLISFDKFARSLPQLRFDRRVLVEANLAVSQPIAIAVIKDKNKNAVLVGIKSKKTLRSGSPELNKTLFWFGGHVREDDATTRNSDSNRSLVDTLRETLRREIKEELDLDIAVASEPKICVWDQSSESGRKHIAFVFLIEHDLQSMRIQVDNKEYGFNDVKLLSFDDYSRLPNMRVDTWSHSILLNLLNWHAGPLFEQTEFNFVR